MNKRFDIRSIGVLKVSCRSYGEQNNSTELSVMADSELIVNFKHLAGFQHNSLQSQELFSVYICLFSNIS